MIEQRDYFQYDDGSAFVITEKYDSMVEVVERYSTSDGHAWTKYVRPVSEIRAEVENGDLSDTGRKLNPDHVSEMKRLTTLPAHRLSEKEQEFGLA
jgi:phytoene dehydrogenase-like protein